VNYNLRTDEKRIAVVKIWAAMARGMRNYCEKNGFVAIHNMPHIVSVTGACENVDTLFRVEWYETEGEDKTPAFAPQSNQLYIEMLTQKLGKVYGTMQSFRREPRADNRRLAQFELFEIEHLGGFEDLLDNIAGIVRSAANEVAICCVEELKVFERDPKDLLNLQFGRMTYADALKRLNERNGPTLEWGHDLNAHDEHCLTTEFGPIFVTHYPEEIKFFNMQDNIDNPKVVNSSDLLLPWAGESAGSAERETDHTKLVRKLDNSKMLEGLLRQGMKREDFNWYLDFHRDNVVSAHSGAGIGMARVAQFILGQSDIRECVPFLINRDNLL
jgi:asparaginyl-tRNA synthetase